MSCGLRVYFSMSFLPCSVTVFSRLHIANLQPYCSARFTVNASSHSLLPLLDRPVTMVSSPGTTCTHSTQHTVAVALLFLGMWAHRVGKNPTGFGALPGCHTLLMRVRATHAFQCDGHVHHAHMLCGADDLWHCRCPTGALLTCACAHDC